MFLYYVVVETGHVSIQRQPCQYIFLESFYVDLICVNDPRIGFLGHIGYHMSMLIVSGFRISRMDLNI